MSSLVYLPCLPQHILRAYCTFESERMIILSLSSITAIKKNELFHYFPLLHICDKINKFALLYLGPRPNNNSFFLEKVKE